MCCLRYEHEAYEEALKTTPPVGSTVETPAGSGVVIETRPLLQTVKVRLDEGGNNNVKLFTCEEITVISAGKGKRPKVPPKENG
jgi:cell fate regulator YaaT (PSP1 superfamily)